MNLIEMKGSRVSIDLDRDELLVINAALNEICNGIDIFELETRIGASRSKIQEILRQTGRILDIRQSR